jgi:hypothetical protein
MSRRGQAAQNARHGGARKSLREQLGLAPLTDRQKLDIGNAKSINHHLFIESEAKRKAQALGAMGSVGKETSASMPKRAKAGGQSESVGRGKGGRQRGRGVKTRNNIPITPRYSVRNESARRRIGVGVGHRANGGMGAAQTATGRRGRTTIPFKTQFAKKDRVDEAPMDDGQAAAAEPADDATESEDDEGAVAAPADDATETEDDEGATPEPADDATEPEHDGESAAAPTDTALGATSPRRRAVSYTPRTKHNTGNGRGLRASGSRDTQSRDTRRKAAPARNAGPAAASMTADFGERLTQHLAGLRPIPRDESTSCARCKAQMQCGVRCLTCTIYRGRWLCSQCDAETHQGPVGVSLS